MAEGFNGVIYRRQLYRSKAGVGLVEGKCFAFFNVN